MVILATALAATAPSTFRLAAATSFASRHGTGAVVRRNTAVAAVVAAIPAVHAAHETHEAPYATVASGRVDSYYIVWTVVVVVVAVLAVPALETVPESDCGLDLAIEAAVGQYGHRRLPQQATTDPRVTSHKNSTM